MASTSQSHTAAKAVSLKQICEIIFTEEERNEMALSKIKPDIQLEFIQAYPESTDAAGTRHAACSKYLASFFYKNKLYSLHIAMKRKSADGRDYFLYMTANYQIDYEKCVHIVETRPETKATFEAAESQNASAETHKAMNETLEEEIAK